MSENYEKIKKYLESFINYEKKSSFSYKQDLSLKKVYVLLDYLNIKYQNLKAVHIAGTKGKGSTAHFCSYLLSACGYKIGVYTSPHFFDFRERIQVQRASKTGFTNNMISKKSVVKIVSKFKKCLDSKKRPKILENISFFEVYTALAFEYFLREKCDFTILETGMGGRLDATNVVNPIVSILTHIGYDHTEILGKSLEKIAYEKSGIIKRNTNVVCSLQKKAVLRQIKSMCNLKNAPLFLYGKDFFSDNIKLTNKQTSYNFKFKDFELLNIKINIKGKHQVENSALAIAACVLLKQKGYIRMSKSFKKGLKEADIKGRFEVLKNEPLIVVDIAHNKSSFLALKQALKVYYPSKNIILIFGCCQDKDPKGMVSQIKYKKLILTSFESRRSICPQSFKDTYNPKLSEVVKNMKEALKRALSAYKKDSIILISGSFFLVAEAKKFLKGRSFKELLQNKTVPD